MPARQAGEASGVVARRLDGREIAPLAEADRAAVVLIFTAVECPIANRYAPEIARLARVWPSRGVRVWVVYPDSTTTAAEARVHLRRYALEVDALLDPTHALVRAAGARVTPEAAVFARGERRYIGRLDDRAPDFGVFRAQARDRTLEAALDATLVGRRVGRAEVRGIGCAIADLPSR